jgi:hypothetical protein
MAVVTASTVYLTDERTPELTVDAVAHSNWGA